MSALELQKRTCSIVPLLRVLFIWANHASLVDSGLNTLLVRVPRDVDYLRYTMTDDITTILISTSYDSSSASKPSDHLPQVEEHLKV